MHTYNTFWQEMSQHYPVSKGSFKLPIASSLLTISDLDHATLVADLKSLLQKILNEQTSLENMYSWAKSANEDFITPLITNDATGIVRFDCVIDANSKKAKVVEINCDYPDGLLLHDCTVSTLTGKKVTTHTEQFLSYFKNQSVYVLHPENAVFLDAYHTEVATLKKSTDVKVGSNLREAKEFDVIRRCIEVPKLQKVDRGTFHALQNKQFLNSFALRTLGYKDLLSTIKSPLVPFTEKLTVENCLNKVTQKDSLVLKPLNGCEGENIFFGTDFSTSDWETLLQTCSNKNYILQERIEMDQMIVPLFADETIVEKELYYDICPHFFVTHGQVTGAGHTLIRFSENKVVNVTQGGGIGYHA